MHAEVHSADSRYGALQSSAIDLRRTPVADFTLQPLLTVSGRVTQLADPPATGTAPVPNATIVFTDLAPPIPDRIVSISAQSDSSAASAGTYTVQLPASTYDVLVAPSSAPVARPDGPVAVSNPSLDLVLPAKASLTHVTGTLQINGTGRLAGAQVSAVDAAGTSIAVPQISASDGTFALDLPPGPPAFSLQVGPAATPSATDPIPSFNAKPFAPGQPAALGIIDLGTLPPPVTVTGKVVDARAAVIASARVFLLSTDATPYVLSRQTTTASDGTFSVVVRAGTYLIVAAPDADPAQPAVSEALSVPIPSSVNLGIVCPDKVKVTGTVVRSDGRAASAGFRVDATRVADQLVAGRGTRTATT
ncbi:MAG: carboxypeptidase regulatory-like domain-containing protein, partial [Deltaproteobacteria bacterium]